MEIYFRNREEWRRWLGENSSSAVELWLVFYKKHTGRQCISYEEAVEEALCFGWIDGKIKRINEEYYIQRYTPRRAGSRWSQLNIERVRRLIKEGKMAQPGLEAYNQVIKNPHLAYSNRESGEPEIPGDLLSALKVSKTALENFMNYSPSARRIYIAWFNSAKRDITRMERIKKIVMFSEQNKRPGMM